MVIPDKIDRESIQAGIENSFALTTYPGDSLLVHLDSDNDPDSQDIVDRLKGKCWQDLLLHLTEIDGPDLYWYNSVYTFLTPDSFYHYLPAFLIVSMDLDRADTVATGIIYYLRFRYEPAGKWLTTLIGNALSSLTPQQTRSIQNWVRYMLQEYPDDKAIERLRFWLED